MLFPISNESVVMLDNDYDLRFRDRGEMERFMVDFASEYPR